MTLSEDGHPMVVATLIDAHRKQQAPLMPLLHAIQDELGYIPSTVEPEIARALNLSAAEVRGVISFYHDFRSSPPGQHVVRICCAEACQARGARAVAAHAQGRLGVGFGDTTRDGRVTLEKVYCFGNCACGPSVAIDAELYANVDSNGFDALLQGIDREVRA